MQTTPLPTVGFVRLSSLLPIIPFSRAKVWRDVRDGKFPAPVKLGDHVTAWRVEDIRAWMADPQGWQGNSK